MVGKTRLEISLSVTTAPFSSSPYIIQHKVFVPILWPRKVVLSLVGMKTLEVSPPVTTIAFSVAPSGVW
jgi:hypothetical protein